MTCIAIQVQTGQEFIVSQKLKRTGFNVINPAQKKLTIRNNSKISIGHKDLIKGYLLIELKTFTDQLWHIIRKTHGVIRILDGFVTAKELERVKAELYPVIEVVENTEISNRSEKILRKNELGRILEVIRNNRKITTFPAFLLNKAIDELNIIIKNCTISKRALSWELMKMVC